MHLLVFDARVVFMGPERCSVILETLWILFLFHDKYPTSLKVNIWRFLTLIFDIQAKFTNAENVAFVDKRNNCQTICCFSSCMLGKSFK